jgi:SOS-response transcriptional repressor LexA
MSVTGESILTMATKKALSQQEVDRRLLVTRLQGAMTARSTNATKLGKAAGLGNTAVHDILSGKNQSPSVPVIRKLAGALDTSVAYLMGETDDSSGAPPRGGMAPIPVIGIAETGAFRPMQDIDSTQEYELPRIHAPRNSSFAAAKHFALEIRGDSMNAARPIPLVAGMHALCLDMVDADLTIESGRIYAVRRTLDGGQTYELTIKRAHVFKNRIELRPESTNKAHKTIEIAREDHDGGTNEVRAIGLVYGVYGSMEIK